MCGITGITGRSNVAKLLYNALLNLEYRGYDSCGIALINNNHIMLEKDKGTVQEVGTSHQFMNLKGSTGIGHTRWATTGIPNQNNAHPHISCDGKFALVHNGIITNYKILRKQLENKGHIFKSDTDTEVIVHLIEDFYSEINDIEEALRKSANMLEGTYAFAFITTHAPNSIFCARKESPLIIGLGDGVNYIGSDYNAILGYTRRVINLRDGEFAIVTNNTVIIKNLDTGEVIDQDIKWLEWDLELSKKGGFPHYMLKEIHEQPKTIKTILEINPIEIKALIDAINNSDRVYLIGVGTTYYVALICQYYFKKLSGKHFFAVSSDEFNYVAQIDNKTLVISFSQSGETYDTLKAIRHAKKHGGVTAAIVNVMGSSLVSEADISIMQKSGPEICVLSTKAATAQIALGLRCAIEYGFKIQYLNETQYHTYKQALYDLPDEIKRIINEKKGFINDIACRYTKIRNWLFIGRSIYYGVALESALKMKEVTYHHAEGIQGGFMKHGTIALIEDGVGSIFFLPPKEEEELLTHTISNAEEIKARNGLIIGFGFGKKQMIFDDQIRLPETSFINAPILLLVLGQLFSYYSAVALNRNVDKPRSLAKSVTVA